MHPALHPHHLHGRAPAPLLPPAGLADLAELEPAWARAAHHAAVAVTAGYVGDAHTWTPWGYPPPAAYRGLVPTWRPPVPASRPPATVPATVPATTPALRAPLVAMATAALPTARA